MAEGDNCPIPESTPVTIQSLAFDLAKVARKVEALEEFCYDPWENGQSLVDAVDDLLYIEENRGRRGCGCRRFPTTEEEE